MTGCRPSATPIEANHRLRENDSEMLIDVGQYQSLVGHLIYLFLTHLDIAYAVSVVSQFMHAPIQDHLEAAYRVFKYLKGCSGKGILYRKHGHHQTIVYTNTDWAGSLTDRRSTLGYCSFVGGEGGMRNLVILIWRSKK